MSDNRALLIVDVQAGFINDSTKHIPEIVERLQGEYEHVYATRFINAEGSSHRKWINWHRFGEGSSEVDLAFDADGHVAVVDKNVYTCITAEFLEDLRGRGVTEVHLCGIDTDACVLKCAVDLFEAGVRPVVIAGACASHAGAEFHEYGLKILRRLIGRPQIHEE